MLHFFHSNSCPEAVLRPSQQSCFRASIHENTPPLPDSLSRSHLACILPWNSTPAQIVRCRIAQYVCNAKENWAALSFSASSYSRYGYFHTDGGTESSVHCNCKMKATEETTVINYITQAQPQSE